MNKEQYANFVKKYQLLNRMNKEQPSVDFDDEASLRDFLNFMDEVYLLLLDHTCSATVVDKKLAGKIALRKFLNQVPKQHFESI